jgi:hypothetical protein
LNKDKKGPTMSKHAVNRVKDAVTAITEKIERASDDVVGDLNKTADETINKFGKVKTALINPLKEANSLLDELLGDNGGPALEDEVAAPFPAAPAEARPQAATAAAPQSSQLGKPTGGLTASDVAKK